MDALAELRSLLESTRRARGLSRNRVAQLAARHGVGVDAHYVRYLEVEQRRPPDPAKLRAVSVVLGLSYEQVTGAVTLGLEPW